MQAQDRPQPKPGKAPVVNIKKPQTFVLANGLNIRDTSSSGYM